MSSTQTKAARDSNLELFRIIAMLLIIACHYSAYLRYYLPQDLLLGDTLSWRTQFLLMFGSWGKTGINCFVLITGYFMCCSQINLRKFLKLLFTVIFYNVLIYLIFSLSGREGFGVRTLLMSAIPIAKISRNFVFCYLLFFLLIPFLNVLVNNMTKKLHTLLLLLLTFIYMVVGSLPKYGLEFNYVGWFCVLYLFGSYIRIYDMELFHRTRLWGWTSLVLVILGLVSIYVNTLRGNHISLSGREAWLLIDCNKPLALGVSISGFLFFKNLRIKRSRFINTLSATTLGVLLIHHNRVPQTRWLWCEAVKAPQAFSESWFVVHALLSVVAVFAVCAVIEHLRLRFVEKPVLDWGERKISSLKKRGKSK